MFTTRKLFSIAALTTMTLGLAIAGDAPVVNIDKHRHGNLAAAQADIASAYKKVADAQEANRDRLGGHAQKAKDLLIQANEELKQAAEFANKR